MGHTSLKQSLLGEYNAHIIQVCRQLEPLRDICPPGTHQCWIGRGSPSVGYIEKVSAFNLKTCSLDTHYCFYKDNNVWDVMSNLQLIKATVCLHTEVVCFESFLFSLKLCNLGTY